MIFKKFQWERKEDTFKRPHNVFLATVLSDADTAGLGRFLCILDPGTEFFFGVPFSNEFIEPLKNSDTKTMDTDFKLATSRIIQDKFDKNRFTDVPVILIFLTCVPYNPPNGRIWDKTNFSDFIELLKNAIAGSFFT